MLYCSEVDTERLSVSYKSMQNEISANFSNTKNTSITMVVIDFFYFYYLT